MAAPGPRDPLRRANADDLLPAAARAAAAAGVTRLADITRLDRLGLPVWQAVRPMSRALSVHQGKGATPADARLGALLEAMESHAAETFRQVDRSCLFSDLPAGERADDMADFALDRDDPPNDGPHDWVAAEELASGGRLWLPFPLVSLDLTRLLPSRFERTSNGVAAGASLEEATCVALQEVVERDAVSRWQAGGPAACAGTTLAVDSIPHPWFQAWVARLDAAGILSRFFFVPSVPRLPVFVCELNDLRKTGAPYRVSEGRGCHPLPELALFKALAEALQGRLTYIAGARDDLLPSMYAEGGSGSIPLGSGLPLPRMVSAVGWETIKDGPVGSAAIAGALAAAGMGPIGVVDLARPEGLHVVRAFVCGLGSMHRGRRERAE